MIFCGSEEAQSFNHETVEIKHEQYIKKVKPISIEKIRRQMVNDPVADREKNQLRGLIGAMQWPAAQSMIHAAAAVA